MTTHPDRHRGQTARRRTGVRPAAALAFCATFAAWVTSAAAEPATLTFDPERTTIRFEVDSTLHLVQGTVRLVRGALRFDTAGGPATGEVVVDATSADTGNGLRDGALHEDVLESERHPRFVFHAEHVAVERVTGNEADVRVTGRLDIHGGEHPLAFPAHVRVADGRAEISASFPVPYVEWGMEDPGNFLLSVDDVVGVSVEAVGRIDPPPR